MNEEQILTDIQYIEFENDILEGRRKLIDNYYNELMSKFPKNAKILDLGCGNGEFVNKLNEAGFDAIGIDLNKKHSENNSYILYGAIPDILETLDSNTFDVVVSFHLIEHLELNALKTMFRETFRLLKPEGQIILETPNTQSLFVMSKYYYQDPTHLMPRHPNLYSLLLKTSGFIDTQIEHVTQIVEEFFTKEKFIDNDGSISDNVCMQLNENFLRIQNLLFDKSGNILIIGEKSDKKLFDNNKIKIDNLSEKIEEKKSKIDDSLKKTYVSRSQNENIDYTKEILSDIKSSICYVLNDKLMERKEIDNSKPNLLKLLFVSDTRYFLERSYYTFLKRMPRNREILEWYGSIDSGMISRLEIYFLFNDSQESKRKELSVKLPLVLIVLKKIGFSNIMKKIPYFKGNFEMEKLKIEIERLQNSVGNVVEYLHNKEKIK
jgi:2-polyprenyl-3-methyl-5-hydroxy-6-metoxy-1,4-benzoquinol methylase